MGLRIIERVREEYGGDAADAHIIEEMNPFTNPSKTKKTLQADTGTGLTLNGGPPSHIDDKGDTGGGFLVDDYDSDGGGFFPGGSEAEQIRPRAGELTIEDEKGPLDSGSSAASLSVKSDVVNYGCPETDDGEGSLKEADLDDKVPIPKKASKKRRKAASNMRGPEGNESIGSPTRRAAPKRKAARKSETALQRHLFAHESDEDDNRNRKSLTSKRSRY